MLALAALLAVASPQSDPALDKAALAAFDRHCATLDSADAMASRIVGAGWGEFTPAPDSDLGKLVGYAAAELAEEIPNFTSKSRSFAPSGDRSLVAIVSEAGIPGMMSLECRIVVLELAHAPDAALVAGWAKREATRTINETGLKNWQWTPGLRATHGETSVAFVARDSPLRAEFPLLGLIVQAMRQVEP